MHTYFLEQINTKEDGLNHDKMVVHSFHCLVLSLAQTPFELSKELGYSLLLVLLLSQLGLLGCSSGGATPRFLHLFRFGYVVFHGANGVLTCLYLALDITQLLKGKK